MKFRMLAGSVAAVALLVAGVAMAEPVEDKLVVNGEIEITTYNPSAPDYIPGLTEQWSGWHFREDDTRSMQADEFDNPGMLGVEQGLALWDAVDGTEGKSCASCHDGIESTKGLRASMPKYNEAKGTMYTMEMYINDCRTERMGAEAWKWNSAEMKGMTAAIGHQSLGMPVNVAIDGPAEEFWKKGEEIYYTRFGQLEMSCATCHEDNYGNFIRADHLSQGQINGFPVYRLKDAGLVSIHQRFKGCIRDTRAETFSEGSPEFIALELYVASRGNGLSVESPAVRN